MRAVSRMPEAGKFVSRQCAVGVLVPILAAVALWGVSAAAVEPGDAAPAWRASTFSGASIEFPRVAEGKPAVMIFWATWCPYCKAFMPYLEQIQSDYAQSGVKIIAINAKERGRGDPQAYVDDLGFPMLAVPEGDGIAQAYAVDFIPGLFVVAGDGTIAYRRAWTELPAGREVAELWDERVRRTLDRLLE